MSVSHQASRVVKKSLVAEKKNAAGSISHDAGDPGNFSGIVGSSANQSTMRKHGIVSQSTSTRLKKVMWLGFTRVEFPVLLGAVKCLGS